MWARENLSALPTFLQQLILNPDYFPESWQTVRFNTDEVAIEVNAGSLLTVYRTLLPENSDNRR